MSSSDSDDKEVIDVTESQFVVGALRKSEARYRELVDNSPIGIYRTTPGGRIVMANSAMVAMFGYSSFEEMASLGLTLEGYHPDTPREKFIELLEKNGEIRGYEAKWVKQDGSVLQVRESAKTIYDDKGGVVYYEGTMEDVTLQKDAEELLAHHIRFEKLITGISTNFVTFGPDELDEGINFALKRLITFMEVDRAYVYQNVGYGLTARVTHEWASEGIELKGSELKKLDVSDYPWCNDRIRSKAIVHIPCVEDLPEEASAEKNEFKAEDVQSLILIPLVCKDMIIGLLGFETIWKEKSWTREERSLLEIVGEIFASAIERRSVEEELRFRVEFDEVIASISSRFIGVGPDEIDLSINDALREIGDFAGVERSYVSEFRDEGTSCEVTHRWESDGVMPLDKSRLHPSFPEVTWASKKLLAGEPVLLSDLNSLPDKERHLLKYLRKHNIKSFVCVPFSQGEQKCFLGFTSEREEHVWHRDTVSLLSIVAEIFAGALERKIALTSLADERMMFDALMGNLSDKIYFKDKESRFIKISRHHTQMFGIDDASEAAGKTDFDYFSEQHAQKAYDDEQKIVNSGEPMLGVEEMETWPDGTETWVSTSKMPMTNEQGEVVGTFGISRDITARKNAEKDRLKMEIQMQHAQKLESLGVLSGGIAHDFNNLLMGVLGHTSMALMDLTPNSAAWDSIKQIETVALRAAELTSQMLAYSGKSKAIIKPVNLNTLVNEMANLLVVSISKKVKLNYDFQDGLPMINGDPVQIRQIVMNLITNASDAMGLKKGEISISTGIMDCDRMYLSECYIDEDQESGKYIYVEVTDTGGGMDDMTIQRIFDPFYTTKVQGHGLGLAAVLGIVRAHKGALRVYSELGKGTVFKILFPCSEEVEVQQEEPSEDTGQTAWKGSGLLVVVDDDEIVRNVSQQILDRLGFSVITAEESREALEIIKDKANDVKLVLLDVNVPGMACGEAVNMIRKARKNLPVVLMSGYNERSVAGDLEGVRYEGFLQKPFNSDMLQQKMKEILS